MDPSIMKKLLEDDEDETMHSGADVEAFQAALNRDIEGDVSASQPSDSDSAVLSQGSNNASSQSLPQLQNASQDQSTPGQVQHDQNITQQRELLSYQMELKQQCSNSENMPQQNDASQEINNFSLPQKQPHNDLQQGQADQKPPQTGMLMSGKHPVSTQEQDIASKPENDSQYAKLQKMSSQQAMTTDQQSTPMNRGKQVPFGLLLPVLLPQLDKDRSMQLQTLFNKLKNNEISKDAFVRHIRSVVGDQMLKMAVNKVQTQPPLKHQLMPRASLQQQPPRMPSSNAGATQFTDPRSFAIQQRGVNPSTDPSHIPTVHVQTDSSHSAIENSAKKLREAERQSDPHGTQVSQMSSSSKGASNQERERSSVPMQVHNKQQQQQLHYPQSSFSMYGSSGGNYHPYPGTNVNTMPLKPQPHDSHLRQVPQHQSMGSAQSGGEAQGTNIMSVPKLERQNSVNEPGRQGGSLPHFTNNSTLQQNPVSWQSSSKDQISGPLSSMGYVKQEPIDQSAEQPHKTPVSNSQRVPYASTVQLEQGNASPGIAMDESLEKQSSRMGFPSTGPSGSMVTSSFTSTGAPLNPVSSTTMTHADPNLGSRIPTGTIPAGINNKLPAKKTSVGQKKPSEALGSPPPPSSGKKQKVSGGFSDQSIEQLNDVTAVSGVNLREEEEQLFSGPKDDTRASEASRRVVQEEEERLILQKHPLQKKLAEIMFKCGLKSINHDVERCLSLCVEERMRGLINNLIRLSKQRVDAEKPKHHTIITSDVQQQILNQNKKAKEEWEKKQAEAEKIRKLNEPEGSNGVDGDKDRDDGRSKPFKANKEEDDKMRTTAANVAARAAVGGDDMLSKWQLMAEQARQKREGGNDVASASQSGKDANRKSTSAVGRILKDNQEAEKRGGSAPVSVAGTVKKFGKSQVMVPQTRVARSISVKDVISVLEREPQMSRSPLIYRLYERSQADIASD